MQRRQHFTTISWSKRVKKNTELLWTYSIMCSLHHKDIMQSEFPASEGFPTEIQTGLLQFPTENLITSMSLKCSYFFVNPPTRNTNTTTKCICGYEWEQSQSHAALTQSYLIMSMRISGVRYLISHHLASWTSVSRINWVRVILLMLLLSSFSSSPTYCTLFKFHAFNVEECLKRKKKKKNSLEIIIDEHQNFPTCLCYHT